MNIFRFTWLLLFLIYLSTLLVNSQMQACSLQGIDIQNCLSQAQNSVSFDSCCETLHQALVAGYNCLCLLLGSSSPLLSTPVLLSFSNCYISVPPLTQCQDTLAVPRAGPALNQPPGTAPQLVNHPRVDPEPVLIPPDIPKDLPLPSSSNGSLLPLPPKLEDIPLTSTPNQNSSADAEEPVTGSITIPKFNIPERILPSYGGDKIKSWFHPRFVLAVAVYSFMQ